MKLINEQPEPRSKIEQTVRQPAPQRPYAMVGAGDLTASIWKSPESSNEPTYVFNVFRMERGSGQVSQRFVTADVSDFVKLAHVLAATLLDDGCLDDSTRHDLRALVKQLETLLPEEKRTDFDAGCSSSVAPLAEESKPRR